MCWPTPFTKIAEDPINLKVVAGRGEPKQFAVISNDGRYRAFGQSVPFPIENTVGSCHISATKLAANYSSVFIVVEGLQPKEDLLIDSQSEGEVVHNKAVATTVQTWEYLQAKCQVNITGKVQIIERLPKNASKIDINNLNADSSSGWCRGWSCV